MTRLLIPLHGFVGWNGGLDLMRILIAGLSAPSIDRQVEMHFALPQTRPQDAIIAAGLRAWRRFRSGADLDASRAGGKDALFRIAEQIVAGRQVLRCANSVRGIVAAAETTRADVVFPSMLPLPVMCTRRIGYIFDFQHKHLPQLFSRRTCRKRDRTFAQIVRHSDAIVVNSRAVAEDAQRFLWIGADRILTLPFAPYCRPEWLAADPLEVTRRYGIAKPYVMICNHFWMHKDHATALRAFADLSTSKRKQLTLVMTGDPIDHRDPGHFARLMDLAHKLGISSDIRVLGLIPKSDQIGLLKGAQVLWQPTRFEGGPGGGAVYEAIGLGVPVVVSDIPVNLEIDQGDIRFFHTGDAEDLAARTAETLECQAPRPDHEALLARGDANLARLGNVVCDYLVQIQGR